MLSGCKTTPLNADMNDVMNDIQDLYSQEGYLVVSDHDRIVWRDGLYYIDVPSSNLIVKYYPEAKDFLTAGPNKDKDFLRTLSMVDRYFRQFLDVSLPNTSINEQNGLFRYGYVADDYVCLTSVKVTDLYGDKFGNDYLDINIGCSSNETLEMKSKAIQKIYEDLGAGGEDSVLRIDKEIDDKYFHISGYSLYGGGVELIVVKIDGKYVEVYSGNSGDIPCAEMYKYSIPQEIYDDCYTI